jgi:hypothetical protein
MCGESSIRMTANEVAQVAQQLRERITAILSPEALARYDAYQQRLQAANERRDTAPMAVAAEEQAVLDTIAADTQAAALHKQLLVLLRIATLPQ